MDKISHRWRRFWRRLGYWVTYPVEVVSYDVHVTAPERGVSVEYGEYLSTPTTAVCVMDRNSTVVHSLIPDNKIDLAKVTPAR